MNWNCIFGHDFSKWLEDKDSNTQERWCKNCQFIERQVIITVNPCDGITHRWSKWDWVDEYRQMLYRVCCDCKWREYKDPHKQ